MTKKLNDDNKKYHGMTFHVFYTFSLLRTVGSFTRPYFTCPKFLYLWFQLIHSCFYLQIAIEFLASLNNPFMITIPGKNYAADETLPIINKPKYPKKKGGQNTRNKMKGPTSKKTKESPKRANHKGNMKLINCIEMGNV
jgi:hypothetical protein